MMRSIHISWVGSILRGCYVVEREFFKTANTAEEVGTVVSKIGGRFCATNEVVTLGGRGWNKSKVGFHGMGGHSSVARRSVGLMVVGVNTSMEIIFGWAIMAVRRDNFCC